MSQKFGTVKCAACRNPLSTRFQKKFCSNKCQMQVQYEKFIDAWKVGQTSGMIGIHVRAVSGHLRRYLIEKYNESCVDCGWNEKNPITGKIPLEVDHIDGNAENNKEDNLRLLCPNCHSLTPFFKNLNRGKGRKWRMDKYIKNPIKAT